MPPHVAHVFPYDPRHLGHGFETWVESQMARWPLASVAQSGLASESSVHVIGPRSRTTARGGLTIREHGSLTSGPRFRDWGDDWSGSLGRYLRDLGPDDVVVLHLNDYAAARLAHRAAQPNRLVIVFHGMGVGQGDDHIRTASAIVVLRKDAFSRLLEEGVDRARVVIMTPSVDRSLFHPPEVPARSRGIPTLGFVGRLEASKGVFELPRVLRGLKDSGVPATVEAIGHGTLAEQESLVSLARDLGVEHSLSLLGERDTSEIANRMKIWRLLLVPSYTEGHSIVVQEARASGLTVAAVSGVLGDEVQEARGIYCDARDAYPELVRRLLQECSSPDPSGVPDHRDAALMWDALLRDLPTETSQPRIPLSRWGRIRRLKPLRRVVRWARQVLRHTPKGSARPHGPS